MKRKLWTEGFAPNEAPPYPCPTCNTGTLSQVADTYNEKTSSFSSSANNPDDWEPQYLDRHFSMLLSCTQKSCGAVSAMSGKIELTDELTEHGWGLTDFLVIKSITPAPHIIEVPEDTPADVEREIEISFALFWVDLGSCANRIRVSIERILDFLKIPATRVTKKGKPVRMDLFERIEEFKKIDSDSAETMDALRHVGNVGSHGDKITKEIVLDSYELYEDALAEIFGKKTAKLKAMKQKIIQAKGKYPEK